jgi:hypothetical protein
MNFGAACEASLRFQLEPPASLREMISDTDVDYAVAGDGTIVTLDMAAKGVKVLVYTMA